MKRFLALALSLLMILSVLLMAGCNSDTSKNTTTGSNKPQDTTGTTTGGNEGPGENTEPTELTGEEKLKGYEDVTFGGEKFVIVGDDGEDDGYNTAKEIYSEESDAISVAVRKRNMVIEALYDCKIELMTVANTGEAISADINGNQHTIDVYVNKYVLASIATGGNAYNLLTVGSRDIDFTQPWWDQKYVNSYTVKNSSGAKVLYAAIGDFALNSFDCTHSLVYNKTVFENSKAKFEAAGIPTDIYQLVRDHEWTVDVFAAMIKAAAVDTNGNQTIDAYNEKDIAGWVRTIHGTHGLHTASGLAILKNTDGVLTFEPDKNTEAWVNVVNKAIEIWAMPEGQTLSYSVIPEVVAGGYALFSSELIGSSLPNLKDYEQAQIGILPYPVYNKGDEYAHYVDNHVSSYSIPSSCDHPDSVADFLTVYAYSSKYIVRPAYMEVYAYEYCADEDSYEMLNIILDTMTYDVGYISTSPNLEGEISDMINNGKNNISQFATRKVSTANEWISGFIAGIDDNKI